MLTVFLIIINISQTTYSTVSGMKIWIKGSGTESSNSYNWTPKSKYALGSPGKTVYKTKAKVIVFPFATFLLDLSHSLREVVTHPYHNILYSTGCCRLRQVINLYRIHKVWR